MQLIVKDILKMKNKIRVYDIALMAILAAILFVLEEVLSFLPNIQLTVFLIILYSKKLGPLKASLIVIVHVILDNLFMNSFNIMYFPFMLIGWLLIPITISTIFKSFNSPLKLAILAICYAFIYCWIFIIPNVLFFKIDALTYFMADIWWEIVLALSSFLSTILLYNPCSKILDICLNNYQQRIY